MNRSLALLFAAAALSTISPAQESIPLEKAQEGARKLNESLGQTGDFPLITNVDLEKPQAFKAGDAGVMVVPDQGLTAEILAAAKHNVVPVGQLWTMNLTLAKGGIATSAEHQRNVTLHTKDKDIPVKLYLLGATRRADGALELVVYGKDKEPLAHAPLGNAGTGSQSFPIEISGEKQDEDTGRLILNILGQQSAELLFKRGSN
jgi:hypothetical protein